jgi:hypothetical protein
MQMNYVVNFHLNNSESNRNNDYHVTLLIILLTNGLDRCLPEEAWIKLNETPGLKVSHFENSCLSVIKIYGQTKCSPQVVGAMVVWHTCTENNV